MSDTAAGLLQLAALLVALAAVWRPWGLDGPRLHRRRPLARRKGGGFTASPALDADSDQRAGTYAVSILAFSLSGVVVLYLLQRLQAVLGLDLGAGRSTRGSRSTPRCRS